MSVKLVLSVSTLIIAAINIPVSLPSSLVFFYFIEVSKKEMQLAMSSRNQDVSVSEKVTAVETSSTKCLINLTSEFA